MDFPLNKLIAIVGQVGAGKSSLVSAILGEMEKIRGSVDIQVIFCLYLFCNYFLFTEVRDMHINIQTKKWAYFYFFKSVIMFNLKTVQRNHPQL